MSKQQMPLDALLGSTADLVLALCPYACACRLQIDVMDGGSVLTNTFHIPLAPSEDNSLEARVMGVFDRHRPGEWVPAKVIANWLDLEADSGYFKRTLSAMAKAGKLESNRVHGYRRGTS